VVSASFAQQLWVLVERVVGRNQVLVMLTSAFVCLALFSIYRHLKSKTGYLRTAFAAIVFFGAYIFAWKQPFMTEKAHVLEYGLLAYLAMRDLDKDKMKSVASVLYSAAFVLIVGSLDEGFQKMLPYRVGEIRDVITNLLSGLFGIALFLAMKRRSLT
jgi:glycopeptide antibiotics resistance protein